MAVEALVNNSDILRHLAVRSSTKDSLLIAWEIANGFTLFVHGYQVRYQAKGSAIVQDSPVLPSSRNNFDITHLHENTLYDVCLIVYTNMTSHAESCLTAATSTHSLSVALGSTFGAFLALGVVVMFVLLAKWQHFRRNRKLFQQHILTADSTESIDDLCIIQENGDIELNCIEMRPLEPKIGQRKDGASPTSDFSADLILHGASVCSVNPGSSGGPTGVVDSTGKQHVLIGLDGCSCANSFILTSPSLDGKTGTSYSLLVPLSASGVLPFLLHQDQAQTQDQFCCDDEASLPPVTASMRPGVKVKYQHPVVRLKLRKHPTIDYSSPEEGWHQKATAHQRETEMVNRFDQACYQTPPYTEMNPPQLNQHNQAEATPSGGQPCLLSPRPTGCGQALPRSVSNTW